jgi:tripartite ATP-independent transporter DctM subunit
VEWWVILVLFFSSLLILLLFRVPVAFALLAINAIAAVHFFGLEGGLRQLVLSTESSLKKFTLVPVPLFILMGEVLFRSGVATRAVEAINRLLGVVPGRLGVLTTVTGTTFAVLSGSTLANTAVLGSTLLPEMLKRGYSRALSMGSILASGGLAMIIPPSALAVVWGATAGVPIGPLLIAGILPGLIMAGSYLGIILGWSTLFRGAPETETVERIPWTQKLRILAVDVLPLGIIVFLVLGLIFLGVATATESAALGAVGSVGLVAAYRRLNRKVLLEALVGTAHITGMIFFIFVGSAIYSQVMSFSGATSGVVGWLIGVSENPLVVLILMQIGIVLLGFFLEQISIMLVTLPFFMPVVAQMGWDPLWFGIIMLINLQIALTTPPLGLSLFVMKGVAPRGTTLTQVYTAAIPFVLSDVVAIGLLIAFPVVVTWLPGLMG